MGKLEGEVLAMGTWGPGIFDNDTALDVQTTFENALAMGLSIDAATSRVLDEYQQWLQDDDDRPLVWLALAALQLDRQALQPEVRRQALASIEGKDTMGRWEEVSSDERTAHEEVLEALKERLIATTP